MAKLGLSQKARTQMVLRALLAPVLMVGLLFLVAGRWNYWQAWVYTAMNTAVLVLMGTLLTKDAGLVEERLNPKEGMKSWDKFYFAITTRFTWPRWWSGAWMPVLAGQPSCRCGYIGQAC
jgi:hypothetical protein